MDDGVDAVTVRPEGRKVAYRVVEGGARPLVVLHGTPTSRFDAELIDAPLVDQFDLRLIAVDRPGYGGSEPAPSRDLRDHAADVAWVCDQLKVDRFVVLGISGGAPYAFACAAAMPDRVLAAASICGVGEPDASAVGTPSSDAEGRRRREEAASAIARDPWRGFREMTKDMPDLDQSVISRPWVRRWAERTFPEGVRQGVVGWELDQHLLTQPWSFAPGALVQPAIFCHGSVDQAAPYDAAYRLSEKMRIARFITVEGGGHFSALTRMSELLETLVSVAPEWSPASA